MLALGINVMAALTVAVVVVPTRLRFEPELLVAMQRYLPAGFLAFFVTTATAVLFAGGGREALPAEQAVAYPVGPTTDHLAALVMAPLNLAWLLQTWTLLFTVSALTADGNLAAAVLPVVLWLLACTTWCSCWRGSWSTCAEAHEASSWCAPPPACSWLRPWASYPPGISSRSRPGPRPRGDRPCPVSGSRVTGCRGRWAVSRSPW